MGIKFITGNKNKYQEVVDMLAPLQVEQLSLDLAEIQSLDAHEIIRHKLSEAEKIQVGEYIIEDTSLYLNCLNEKLPGPYIKWFLESLGAKGIYELASKMGNTRAKALSIFGFSDSKGNLQYFEGVNYGDIVPPKGDKDFGWGPIFKPDGYGKTYGEMEREEKYAVSMRGLAAKKLKEYLQNT